MLQKKFLILSAICLIAFNAKSAQITETKNYTYTIIPFYEMTQEDRMDLIDITQEELVEELRNHLPEGKLSMEAIEALHANRDKITELVGRLNHYVAERAEENKTLKNIFRLHDAIPSAYMLLAGGKFSINVGVGGGGSATFAVVSVPVKIIKTDKITREVYKYYALRGSVVVFPIVDAGAGKGGGVAIRFGGGLVWGDLEDPGDFYGATIGVSGSLSAGVGNNFKLGLILGLNGIKNIYATGTLQLGVAAELSAHMNVGAIIPISEFMKTIDVETGELEDPSFVLETDS